MTNFVGDARLFQPAADIEGEPRPWDSEAVEELRRLANDGLTAREIARKIGRSEDGTRLRLRLEGLVSPRASRWGDW